MAFDLDVTPLLLLMLASLRVGMIFLMIPVLGGALVPRRVRVLLAFALGFLFVPSDAMHVPAGGIDLTLAVGHEVGLGALLGGIARLLLTAPLAAGDLIASEMGLRASEEVDPFSQLPASAIGRLYETIALLVLLGTGVHLELVRVMGRSFKEHPVGSLTWPDARPMVVQGIRDCMEYAVLLALPLYGVLIVSVVVVAFLARAVPQLQIMQFGFALRIAGGLLAGALLLPGISRPLRSFLTVFQDRLSAMAGA